MTALGTARAKGAATDPFDPRPSLDGHRMHLILGVPFDTPLRICFAMMRELRGEEGADPDEETTSEERRVDALRQRNDRMRRE